jgi:hypothetical protein
VYKFGSADAQTDHVGGDEHDWASSDHRQRIATSLRVGVPFRWACDPLFNNTLYHLCFLELVKLYLLSATEKA